MEKPDQPGPSLALFQPDIPQNCGTMLRLCACLGVPAHIIEPCGFIWDDRKLRRAGMDYLAMADLTRHISWQEFQKSRPSGQRLVLMTTQAATSLTDYQFCPGDMLLMGSESAGAPDYVHDQVTDRVTIPLIDGMRSLNVAMAAAMALGEALRQLKAFPAIKTPLMQS